MGNEQNPLSQVSLNSSPDIANSGVTRKFLLEMDEILNLPPGTLRGHEKLEELENWDSTSLVIFIALAEVNSGVSISPAQIVTCSTVSDLLRLARADGSPA
jgi:acyl carrier protein